MTGRDFHIHFYRFSGLPVFGYYGRRETTLSFKIRLQTLWYSLRRLNLIQFCGWNLNACRLAHLIIMMGGNIRSFVLASTCNYFTVFWMVPSVYWHCWLCNCFRCSLSARLVRGELSLLLMHFILACKKKPLRLMLRIIFLMVIYFNVFYANSIINLLLFLDVDDIANTFWRISWSYVQLWV